MSFFLRQTAEGIRSRRALVGRPAAAEPVHSTAVAGLSRRDCLAVLTTFSLLSACKTSAGKPPPLPTPTASTHSNEPVIGSNLPPLQEYTPEQFGALGDGQTNDSEAFARMSAAVNAAGGGYITLKATTYIVGGHTQDPTGVFAYAPATIMTFDGCTRDLVIHGNGARLRCQDGLRFGTFDPITGEPTQHTMPYTGTGELASPYVGMVVVQNCRGQVYIKALELDGNFGNLIIGGTYGDTGWQIPAYGLRLINNSSELVIGVRAHHQPVDGIIIDAPAARSNSTKLQYCSSEYNVRQGCSVIGGSNFIFQSCNFNHSGKAGMVSAPGAGFDIEAESSPIRNLSFSNCEFSNNSGTGLGADSGDSEGATFDGCRFIGTTNWAVWPRKPSFLFTNCVFVGSICNTYGDDDPAKAAQFKNCTFTDDPALSPTGEVYNASFPAADLSSYRNVLFESCTFNLAHALVLPWSVYAIYSNVVMSQAASKQAYPRGTYVGVNTISGNVDLTGSAINGDVTVNGVLMARSA